jgi:hypothetical protein
MATRTARGAKSLVAHVTHARIIEPKAALALRPKKEVWASAEISVRLIEMQKRRTKRKSPRQEGGPVSKERSTPDLYRIVSQLTVRGIAFKVIDDPSIDTTSRTGKLIMGILALIAEFENDIRRERQQRAEVRRSGRA